MYNGKFVSAVILAAGSSQRMGRDKITAELCGAPVLIYSVRCFEKSCADEIIIATAAEKTADIEKLLSQYEIALPIKVIAGGENRAQSAAKAVYATDSRCEIVSIHDGARPLATPQLADKAAAAAAQYGAALAAVRAKDTVKICDASGKVSSTPDRTRLWQAQTPQAFSKAQYLDALSKAESLGDKITDDASLMELCGYEVSVVEGEYSNIKLTSPEDFKTAAVFLSERSGRDKGAAMRIGHGYDVHRFEKGRKLILCGEEIPTQDGCGLLGHSDADVAVHALMDAMLGAMALGDIGQHFPDSDDRYKGISSILLLKEVSRLIRENGAELSNADITIIAEKPKLMRHIPAMRHNLAKALSVDVSDISVKATTEEGLGIGGEGIAAHAVVLLRKIGL